jgi:hypothetical protein
MTGDSKLQYKQNPGWPGVSNLSDTGFLYNPEMGINGYPF